MMRNYIAIETVVATTAAAIPVVTIMIHNYDNNYENSMVATTASILLCNFSFPLFISLIVRLLTCGRMFLPPYICNGSRAVCVSPRATGFG